MLYTHAKSGSVRVLYGIAGFGLTDTDPSAFGQSPHALASSCLLYGVLDDINPPLPLPECLLGPTDYSPLLMIEEEGDTFGATLSAGDFNSDGRSDLAIGSPGEDLGQFVNWALEEEATIPDELLVQFGIPVPLEVDEAVDAGALNIVYGPFPAPTNPPAHQDLLYREGASPLSFVRGLLHSLPIFQDNQIVPEGADPSAGGAIAGDAFGTGLN